MSGDMMRGKGQLGLVDGFLMVLDDFNGLFEDD